MEQKPSTYDLERWIFALGPEYLREPDGPIELGKFLIFRSEDEIDELCEEIKQATEEGRLGGSSKVSTAYPNEYNSSRWVICVYCCASWDEEGKQRVSRELKDLGIGGKLRYKTDEETRHDMKRGKGQKGTKRFKRQYY